MYQNKICKNNDDMFRFYFVQDCWEKVVIIHDDHA